MILSIHVEDCSVTLVGRVMRLEKLLVESMVVNSWVAELFLSMSMLKSPAIIRCFFSLIDMSRRVSSFVKNLEVAELGERYREAMIRFLSASFTSIIVISKVWASQSLSFRSSRGLNWMPFLMKMEEPPLRVCLIDEM